MSNDPERPNMTQKVVMAAVLGTAAYQAGRPRIPALDRELLALLKGNEIGEGIPLLQAWLHNWDLSNLSASWQTQKGNQP